MVDESRMKEQYVYKAACVCSKQNMHTQMQTDTHRSLAGGGVAQRVPNLSK